METVNLVDLDFMDARARLLDLASFLDRVDRANQTDDFRYQALIDAIPILAEGSPKRAEKILLHLSDPSLHPIDEAHTKGATGAFDEDTYC